MDSDKTTNAEMKACPFCGHMPRMDDDGKFVRCSTLGCAISVKCFDIDAWNTRAVEDAESVAWQKIIAFLMGIGELDGCHFGEKQPWHKGSFWWREHIRQLETSHPPRATAAEDAINRNLLAASQTYFTRYC